MNRLAYRIASLLSFLSAAALVGCMADATEDPSAEDELEDVASASLAYHEATCLDTSNDGIPDYDAYTYASFPTGACGGNYGKSLSADATYGVSTCPNQFRARFGLSSSWIGSQAKIEWPSTATSLNSSNCGVAVLRGSFWAQRRSDGVWEHLADTEHVGQWTGSACVFNTPVSGYDNFPSSISPQTYSSVHVAANAAYFFVKQPVRVSLVLTPPAC